MLNLLFEQRRFVRLIEAKLIEFVWLIQYTFKGHQGIVFHVLTDSSANYVTPKAINYATH